MTNWKSYLGSIENVLKGGETLTAIPLILQILKDIIPVIEKVDTQLIEQEKQAQKLL